MIKIKQIIDTYNGSIPIFVINNATGVSYDYNPKWDDDGIRYTFIQYNDIKIKLDDKQLFKIFDRSINQWSYFRYYSPIFKDNKLVSPEYIEPVSYWFTKENIITYIGIGIAFITGLLGIIF